MAEGLPNLCSGRDLVYQGTPSRPFRKAGKLKLSIYCTAFTAPLLHRFSGLVVFRETLSRFSLQNLPLPENAGLDSIPPNFVCDVHSSRSALQLLSEPDFKALLYPFCSRDLKSSTLIGCLRSDVTIMQKLNR